MGVDYSEQYQPEELEPFWPNEILKMTVAVLVTLAVVMACVVIPVALEELGIHHAHVEEPADPRHVPPHIVPEWYFLAVYQYLRLMPQEIFGISGKTLGVLSSGGAIFLLVIVPFLYRKRARRRPGFWYRAAVTTAIAAFLILTVIPIWPPDPLFTIATLSSLIIFYSLIASERRGIRKYLKSHEDSQ